MTYKQAYKDHSYLWSIAPPEDLSGGYIDQDDLEELLKNPTKKTAKECLCNQIDYWFQVGVEIFDFDGTFEECCEQYPKVIEILKRHPQQYEIWKG